MSAKPFRRNEQSIIAARKLHLKSKIRPQCQLEFTMLVAPIFGPLLLSTLTRSHRATGADRERPTTTQIEPKSEDPGIQLGA